MNLTCISIVLILTMELVSSEVLSGAYKVTRVNWSDYGRPLETFYIPELVNCFAVCQRESECDSVVYSKESHVCHTNGIAVQTSTFMTTFELGEDVFYYVGKVEETLSTIRGSCTTNAHCVDLNSLCRDNICRCYFGYAHNSSTNTCVTFSIAKGRNFSLRKAECLPLSMETDAICRYCGGYSQYITTNTCVTSCSAYGSTFQEETGRYIQGYNDDTIENTTDANCKTLCLQATSFTCRSYEFDYSRNKCFLQAQTSQMVPTAAVYFGTQYTMFTRDCA